MRANESRVTLQPSRENLEITLKNIWPSPGWGPSATVKGVMPDSLKSLKLRIKCTHGNVPQPLG